MLRMKMKPVLMIVFALLCVVRSLAGNINTVTWPNAFELIKPSEIEREIVGGGPELFSDPSESSEADDVRSLLKRLPHRVGYSERRHEFVSLYRNPIGRNRWCRGNWGMLPVIDTPVDIWYAEERWGNFRLSISEVRFLDPMYRVSGLRSDMWRNEHTLGRFFQPDVYLLREDGPGRYVSNLSRSYSCRQIFLSEWAMSDWDLNDSYRGFDD